MNGKDGNDGNGSNDGGGGDGGDGGGDGAGGAGGATLERGFLLRGRVQGVGFRWWTRKTAERLGVAGTVRNLPDGSVEVMARADEESMERFRRELRRGPATARVDRVDEVASTLRDGGVGFTIEH